MIKRGKQSYLLLELMVAFTIASITLSGCLALFHHFQKGKMKPLIEAAFDLTFDRVFVSILKNGTNKSQIYPKDKGGTYPDDHFQLDPIVIKLANHVNISIEPSYQMKIIDIDGEEKKPIVHSAEFEIKLRAGNETATRTYPLLLRTEDPS